MFSHYIETLETFVRLCRCTKMIWNYIETAGLVSLHVMFRNLVASVITSGETTLGHRELQMFRKLEHRPRHYKFSIILIQNVIFGLKQMSPTMP